MRGIYINGQHTGQNISLVMTEKNIGTPVVQTYKVDVPGRNGSLDLSEFLTGDICYSNRSLNFKFIADGNREKILTAIDKMMMFHGQQADIILEDYSDYYYKGRIAIDCKDYGCYAEFEMSVDAKPFRMAREKKRVVFDIASAETIHLENPGVSVIPNVTVSSSVTIVRNEKRISLSKGQYYLNELKLLNGSNDFSVEGNAEVIFEYREAFI